ncbi:hypothetical protein BO78DRAFT_439365 [Aspergillus sclerotiicarbonarius CBS 121057]|uniref:Uncharacterized protein n=1 Tax=Aspergillus sclerotiicarbonarius (strain CBS 121057 / IBT 28362) TaxID=1448318 RepID=A0A319EFY0_ASPSB|nr:hypothetical protein BO78DRAFT_439365 [Aspergillus sclerotiicarbonarius CBS 121057]
MVDNDIRATRRSIFRKCWDLVRAVNSIESPLLGIDELRQIGIHPIRTEVKSNESLEFQPCYFQPLDTSVLSKYPVLPGWRVYEIEEGLTYESCLAAVLEKNANEENPENEAREDQEIALEEIREWGRGLDLDLRRLDDRISSHLECHRSGIPGFGEGGALENLTPLQTRYTSTDHVHRALWMMEIGGPGVKDWRLLRNLEHPSAKLPHGIVRGILRWTVNMYGRTEFTRHVSYPLLSIWYTGPRHGRIIQSHHDGDNMVLQYSPLMSFEDTNAAPTSLFVRYGASLPIPECATSTRMRGF